MTSGEPALSGDMVASRADDDWQGPVRGTDEWPVVSRDARLLATPRASAKLLTMYVQCGKRAGYDDFAQELIIGTYFATCDGAGLDPLLVVSQLILESDNLTRSSAERSRLDPVGIAAAKRPGTSTGFRSWLQASRVHAGLVLAFALPKGSENDVQARLLDEALRWRTVPDDLRGSAPTLDRLAKAWTAPQPAQQYAERLRRIANTILEPQY